MFLVPTYLALSSINGIGVFAAADIPAGTVVWEYTPGLDVAIPFDQAALVPEPTFGFLKRYAYVPKSIPGIYILCADNGRFINHSVTPNIVDEGGEVDRAVRLIHKDEEITCDYFKDFAPDVVFGLKSSDL
jgi:hypothetical protein